MNQSSPPSEVSSTEQSRAQLESELQRWMTTRPDPTILGRNFADDVANLGEVFRRPLGKRDKFYEFKKKSTAAGKIYSLVWPRLDKDHSNLDLWPYGPQSTKDFRVECSVFPDSTAGKKILDEAARLLKSSDPREAGLGYGIRIALEMLDLYNAAMGHPAATLWRVQFHRTQKDKNPPAGYWHPDGGLIASTLTLTGRGTDYVTSPDKHYTDRDFDGRDFATARTGTYLYFAGKDLGGEDISKNDAVLHRGSPDAGQDRSIFIGRFKKIGPHVTREFCDQ